MDSLEQELLQDAEDDARTVEFIKNYLPQEVKDKFTDEELYYFLDVIVEYYANSGILDAAPDKDGYIEIDQDKIVDYVVSQARKDKMGDFAAEDILWVVQGELESKNSINAPAFFIFRKGNQIQPFKIKSLINNYNTEVPPKSWTG